MNKASLLICLILGNLLSLGVLASEAQNIKQCAAWNINYSNAKTLGVRLKMMARKNDSSGLAAQLHYPLQVNITQKPVQHLIINDQDDFIAHYKTVFNDKLQKKLAAADVKKNIFCNAQGGMFASGLVWFNPYDNILLINVINTP
jgi:hypothetical protein